MSALISIVTATSAISGFDGGQRLQEDICDLPRKNRELGANFGKRVIYTSIFSISCTIILYKNLEDTLSIDGNLMRNVKSCSHQNWTFSEIS